MNRHSWKKRLQSLVLVLLSLNLSLLGLSSIVLADSEATEESTVVAQDSSSDSNGHQSGQNVGTSQDVDAKAAIAMDAKTGQILYQKTRENVIRLLPPLRFSHWPSLKKIFRLIS